MLNAAELHQVIADAKSIFISPEDGVYRVTLLDGTVRDITGAEIADAEAAFAAAAADQTAYESDRADLKAQFSTAAARLAQIRDAASPTNAQVIQAVRDLATYQLKLLKYIRKL